MDKQSIEKVCSQVYEQFPQYEGVQPEVRSQPNDTHLLIFQSSGKTSNQKAIQLSIRVLVNEKGEVLKITTSR